MHKLNSKLLLSKCIGLDKSFNHRLDNMSLKQPFPHQKLLAEQHDFKEQSIYFKYRNSLDTKSPISSSSEGNWYIMVQVDAFTHYVALNPVPNCNAYYAYTTLYEH